ncbi:hypothetical protein XENOCAPTIV_018545, partial [Xenoophorus captivus]
VTLGAQEKLVPLAQMEKECDVMNYIRETCGCCGGGVTVGETPSPWKPLAEEGSPSLVPTSLESVASLLSSLNEQQYGVGIATMAYTAQRAKLTQGVDREQWTNLFIDSFKYVYGDLTGDPEKAFGLC